MVFYCTLLVALNSFALVLPRPGPDSETCKVLGTYRNKKPLMCNLASIPGFLFQILSSVFGEKKISKFFSAVQFFSETKSRMESLGSRLIVASIDQLYVVSYLGHV